jgi:hypothetical protein
MNLIKLTNVSNFNEARRKKLDEALDLLDRVLASQAFKQGVLNFGYSEKLNGHTLRRTQFRMNQGLSNQQIYELLLSGKDKFEKEPDGLIEVDLALAMQRHNGVLGFTYPNVVRVWINSWFFDSAKLSEIAGNIMHEYCHKSGFEHEFKSTSLRPYTVPYAIGYLVRDLAARMPKGSAI